jgi:hypothetical protein
MQRLNKGKFLGPQKFISVMDKNLRVPSRGFERESRPFWNLVCLGDALRLPPYVIACLHRTVLLKYCKCYWPACARLRRFSSTEFRHLVAINSGFSPIPRTPNCELMDGPLTLKSSHVERKPFQEFSNGHRERPYTWSFTSTPPVCLHGEMHTTKINFTLHAASISLSIH